MLEQGVAADAAVDADDEAEGARAAGRDSGVRVLDDDALGGGEAEQLRGVQVGVGGGLAGDRVAGGEESVDDDLEAVADPRGLEHRHAVARGGDDGDLDARGDRGVDQGERAGVRGDAVLGEVALKASFLRLPSPQTVSSAGSSLGVPSGRVMPREASRARTPS